MRSKSPVATRTQVEMIADVSRRSNDDDIAENTSPMLCHDELRHHIEPSDRSFYTWNDLSDLSFFIFRWLKIENR